MQVTVRASGPWAIDWKFLQHLLRFNYFARAARRIQGNSSFTRLPVYYKRVWLRNSQMEAMHRSRYGKGQKASMSTLRLPFSQISTWSPTQKFSEPSFVFSWRFCYVGMTEKFTDHWQLIQPPAPSPLRRSGSGIKISNPLITWLVPLATRLHLKVKSKSHSLT